MTQSILVIYYIKRVKTSWTNSIVWLSIPFLLPKITDNDEEIFRGAGAWDWEWHASTRIGARVLYLPREGTNSSGGTRFKLNNYVKKVLKKLFYLIRGYFLLLDTTVWSKISRHFEFKTEPLLSVLEDCFPIDTYALRVC